MTSCLSEQVEVISHIRHLQGKQGKGYPSLQKEMVRLHRKAFQIQGQWSPIQHPSEAKQLLHREAQTRQEQTGIAQEEGSDCQREGKRREVQQGHYEASRLI